VSKRDEVVAPPPLRGAIVAMPEGRYLHWGHIIGVDGKLPWHHGEDLKRFKRRTMGCAIIMGRVTWDSIGRKALPGRRNIVISRSVMPNVEHYNNIEQAINACESQDLWVIGGAQIYHMAEDYLNLLDITWVPNIDVTGRDNSTQFPKFDLSDWYYGRKTKFPGDSQLKYTVYRRNIQEYLSEWYTGKRVFNTYYQKKKTNEVKSALDNAGIEYYETRKGKWRLGLAGLWVSNHNDYHSAKLLIKRLQWGWLKHRSVKQTENDGLQTHIAPDKHR